MFQKGTGERFKYKQAVKLKFEDAVCKRYVYGQFGITFFRVLTPSKSLSEGKKSAEKAWADAWVKHVKQ